VRHKDVHKFTSLKNLKRHLAVSMKIVGKITSQIQQRKIMGVSRKFVKMSTYQKALKRL
jgi:hypothetical protein